MINSVLLSPTVQLKGAELSVILDHGRSDHFTVLLKKTFKHKSSSAACFLCWFILDKHQK